MYLYVYLFDLKMCMYIYAYVSVLKGRRVSFLFLLTEDMSSVSNLAPNYCLVFILDSTGGMKQQTEESILLLVCVS